MKQKKTLFFTACLTAALALIFMACDSSEGGDGDGDTPQPLQPITVTAQGVAYKLVPVPAGTVTEANTGVGNSNNNWGAGNNSAYTKPYTMAAFYIGETEITYELWYAVKTWAVSNKGYVFANQGKEGNDGATGAVPTTARQEPVTVISWRDAVAWCNAYSEAVGRAPAYKYMGAVLRESEGSGVITGSGKAEQAVIDTSANGFRLPTEAQWEYAARGGVPGTDTPWTYTYAGSNTVNNVAVYFGNSGSKTAAVKSKAANSLGLYDMTGNVHEWCRDVYSGTRRVLRGGCWTDPVSRCVVSYRHTNAPAGGLYEWGFRVVCP
jgi:formylglycine-generating enzyme required for sulfatase activity